MSITVKKNTVKIMEHAKSAGTLQPIMADAKRGVLIEGMELLLKFWLDDEAQRRISVSQDIISAKVKSLKCYSVLYEEKKKKLFN
jgi:hypothetical protein